MTTQRTHTLSVQGQGSRVQLGELRWLVAQLSAAPDDATVTISKFDGDQRDPGYVTLTANVPDAPQKIVGGLKR